MRRTVSGTAAAVESAARRVHAAYRFPWRVAEAPALIPPAVFAADVAAVKRRLMPLLDHAFLLQARAAVPARFRSASARRPQFFATDFARAVDGAGQLWRAMPELQSFPGNYYLWQALQPAAMEQLQLVGSELSWRGLGALGGEVGQDLLRHCVLADVPPQECAILEVAPETQKTFIDALLMARSLCIAIVDVKDVRCETGGALFAERWLEVDAAGPHEHRGRRGMRRVHSRCLPLELDAVLSLEQLDNIFRRSEECGGVSFSVHPEDFFLLSKATLAGAHLDPPLLRVDPSLPQRLQQLGLDLRDGVLKPVDGAGGAGVLGVRETLDAATLQAAMVPEGSPLRYVWQKRYSAYGFRRTGLAGLAADAVPVQQELRLMWILPPVSTEPLLCGTMVRWSEQGEMASAGRARAPFTGTQCVLVGSAFGIEG
ncbi:MAG: hypothetical protein EXS14_05075 [Planctomycetes bacterium]|nr:hypothetical protein [Planctomycetota bacterium]